MKKPTLIWLKEVLNSLWEFISRNSKIKILVIILTVEILLILALFVPPSPFARTVKNIKYTDLNIYLESSRVTRISLSCTNNFISPLYGEFVDERGEKILFRTDIFSDKCGEILQKAEEKDIPFSFGIPFIDNIAHNKVVLLIVFGSILIFVLVFFTIREKKAGYLWGKQYAKTKARRVRKSTGVTFKDVGGCEEAVEELKSLAEFLRNPEKFTRLGARMQKGYLLVGPPGTGKTLLAKAVAGEADVEFFSERGTDFVQIFVGTGASRVSNLFEKAKKNSPCIVFIDEIDAIGRKRGGFTAGTQEYENTMLQLCAYMDGFEASSGIIVMAATNRPDVLDPALTRPGRFDKQIVVDKPDLEGRKHILKIHMRKIKLHPKVDVEKIINIIAKRTPGLVGADLENIVNQAALRSARRMANFVEEEDFIKALDSVIMGGEELKSKLLEEEERTIVAYHEAGHAVTAWVFAPEELNKVSIIRRGRSLGLTLVMSGKDRHIYQVSYLMNKIRILFGGRVAEKMLFREISSGAENDLQQATFLARQMVCCWGMSEKVGPVFLIECQSNTYLGVGELNIGRVSEETSKTVDEAIKEILTSAEMETERVLKENSEKLHKLAAKLLEKETLEKEEIEEVLAD